MKKHILFLSLFCLFAWSCGKNEDDLTPSGLEKDWLVLEDSEDPIDHLRYEIYTQTGYPIYYNDTVGSEERYSAGSGLYYTYYEVLQVFYSPGAPTPGSSSARYTLVKDKNSLEDLLIFLRDKVLPEVPENTYLPSILVVDTLITPTGDSLAYKGLNTTVLGQAHRFQEMTDAEKDLMKGAFLASCIMSTLSLNEAEWLENEFYALSYATVPSSLTGRVYSTDAQDWRVYSAGVKHIGFLGMIGTKTGPSTVGSGNRLPDNPYHPNMWVQPTQAQDVQQYCQAILAYPEEEFMERYAKGTIYTTETIDGYEQVVSSEEVEFPVVKEKYYVMRAKLEEYGFTIK